MRSLFNIDLSSIKAFAHSRGDEYEKFEEHSKLTHKYYNRIIDIYGIKKIYHKLLKDIGLDYTKITVILEEFIKFHDIGKLTDNFQKRLSGEKLSETHSDKGFFVLIHELLLSHKEKIVNGKGYFALFIMLYTVYKHHGKLDNVLENISSVRFNYLDDKLDEISRFTGYKFDDYIIETMEKDIFWQRWNNSDSRSLLREISGDSFSFFVLQKLFFSLLITSDYFATMEFSTGEEVEINILKNADIDEIAKNFHDVVKLGDFNNFNVGINKNKDKYQKTSINGIYCEDDNDKKQQLNLLRSLINVLSEDTLEGYLKEDLDNNVFFLNIPTGGGKTNISLRLAIKIMEKRKVSKLFSVFPFINIIEQSYETFSNYIPDDQITRLDSRFISSEETDSMDAKTLYANHIDTLFFNKPVLFLSHVKFFDLFFRNDKNSNYNFYQLANSVVIIDEIQAYSDTVWTEVSYILRNIGKFMNTYFIMMSATLPELGKLSTSNFLPLLTEKQLSNLFDHELFKRTEIKVSVNNKEKIIKTIKDKAGNKDKILLVFNQVSDSRDYYYQIVKDKSFKEYDKYLLNSTILEARRKDIIRKAKGKGKMILVSTQSVEAGVDIDFDIGFRAYAPWDSIVQVAGRINRNNEKPLCELYVFKDDDYDKVYRRSSSVKAEIAHNKFGDFFKNKDVIFSEVNLIEEFYKEVIDKIGIDNKTPFIKNSSGNISDIHNLFYKVVDKEIHLIDGETLSLFIPVNDEAVGLWQEYVDLFDEKSNFQNYLKIKDFRKKLLPYSINVFNSYTKSGKISRLLQYEMQYGYYYCEEWEKYYSIEKGLDSIEFKKLVCNSRIGVFL